MLEGGPDRALSFNAEYLPHQESSSFDAEYLASLECLRLRQAARTRTRSAKSTEFEGPRPHIRSNSDEALARHEGPRPHIRSNSDEALARQEDSELFDSELFDSELFVTARGADPSMEESKGLPYMMSPRNRRPDYFSMLCADSRLPNPTTDQGKNDSNAHPFEALVNRLALLAGSMQM
ncbi:MAG: uncharacterized protein KVP18_000754 [Porospora cf. gigantea A]|uniref:uncharacterized protein n=1 Tax=Porospora cf. gigantea A TaxID=2853593 RepID=UPI0035598D65|nr:MAG: hypothetical protein KVP18_000754 [Porospora cf. gigantea A]